MIDIFHCYEFLLLRKLQDDEGLWQLLKDKIKELVRKRLVMKHDGNGCWSALREDEHLPFAEEERRPRVRLPTIGQLVISDWYQNIPKGAWFLAVTLEEENDRLVDFVWSEIQLEKDHVLRVPGQTFLSSYLSSYSFVELHLDSIFKYGDNAVLPRELFRCINVRNLSLKYNFLDSIPPDIGRMSQLERLALTNNKLQNKSIPYTITFCWRLSELYLDNNLLDALPGFLLNMPCLRTVHRHGNHNYFKATFMWYHTDVNDRILYMSGSPGATQLPTNPESLQFLAARAVIATKMNFFLSDVLPQRLKDFISDLYSKFNVCGNCSSSKLQSESGYKVFTFKNPYLGNTCVPFQHWACCLDCAEAIEIPARVEQIAAAREQDLQYHRYIQESQTHSAYKVADRSPVAPGPTDVGGLGCVIL